MDRWTRFIARNRRKVLVAWAAAFVLGVAAAFGLGDLLSNRFSVPGAEAERGLALLRSKFNERSDGTFSLVLQSRRGAATEPSFVRAAQRAAARAAGAVDGAKPGPLQQAGRGVAFAQISTPLEQVDAAERTEAMRRAIGRVEGARTYLSGPPAILHDTRPIEGEDIARGELIAIPIAVAVLVFMFGTLVAVAVPLLFALVTIPPALGVAWVLAHAMDMATYVQQIVTLVGLAIAIDYSMLVVFRYREELERHDSAEEALERTMSTAGRATIFSGMTVAIGLGLLALMPLPFMRSLGIGGLLVPLVSIVASATFLPALLAVFGRRFDRLRVIPRRLLAQRSQSRPGLWSRLARSIMRRPVPYLLAAAGLTVALAVPATEMRLSGGDNRSIPRTEEATRGLALLERTLGPGALVPHQVVVDTGRAGGAWSAESLAAQRRLVAALARDPEVERRSVLAPALLVERPGRPDRATLAALRRSNLVDAEGRVLQVRAAGRSDAGTEAAQDLVHRIRERYVPGAGLGSAEVLVTGAPAFGVDFLDKAYAAFPWLVLAVLVITYFVLLRAFRSVVLPLKAVFMNVLSVLATYGLLVLAFQHGWAEPFGLDSTPQLEGWLPIFLFAMLFGLSMDYEVFLLTRMREEWDERGDNEEAVALGLEHTGRIITAAAIIMVAAFAGFMAASFVGLQEFGLGLAAAILLDATIVRAVMVPATMRLLGRWNWYLPDGLRRALRLAPAPGGSPPA